MPDVLLSYAPLVKDGGNDLPPMDTVPDSVAKLIVEITDVKGQNLAKQSGSSCATAVLGLSAERLAVLRGPTMLVSQPAKANSTGHQRTVSLHTNASPPHLPEFLDPVALPQP